MDRKKKIDSFSFTDHSGGQIAYIIGYIIFMEWRNGAANFWAELDLNQRRHIANEFTVRPH